MREIQLTKGLVTLVDDEDYEFLSQWKWHAHKKRNLFYAARSEYRPSDQGNTRLSMHRILLSVGPRVQVDHQNGNTLDNQRHNLRISTHSQNLQNCKIRSHNTSGFVGVYWHPKNQNFYCKLRTKHIGCFDTAEQAARARDAAARLHFGSFGTYNFPLPGERPAR